MSTSDQIAPYPGQNADVSEVVDLADEYCCAAKTLFQNTQKKSALSVAPARYCAMQAIELYLNAFLRNEGLSPNKIRGRGHDLADDGFVAALRLKKKTAEHLVKMTRNREYLIARYGPELISRHSELTRLTATLDEVRTKLSVHLNAPGRPDEAK